MKSWERLFMGVFGAFLIDIGIYAVFSERSHQLGATWVAAFFVCSA